MPASDALTFSVRDEPVYGPSKGCGNFDLQRIWSVSSNVQAAARPVDCKSLLSPDRRRDVASTGKTNGWYSNSVQPCRTQHNIWLRHTQSPPNGCTVACLVDYGCLETAPQSGHKLIPASASELSRKKTKNLCPRVDQLKMTSGAPILAAVRSNHDPIDI